MDMVKVCLDFVALDTYALRTPQRTEIGMEMKPAQMAKL